MGRLVVGLKQAGQRCLIGRDATPGACDIVLEHASVSRRHAQLSAGTGALLSLTDLGSGAQPCLSLPECVLLWNATGVGGLNLFGCSRQRQHGRMCSATSVASSSPCLSWGAGRSLALRESLFACSWPHEPMDTGSDSNCILYCSTQLHEAC